MRLHALSIVGGSCCSRLVAFPPWRIAQSRLGAHHTGVCRWGIESPGTPWGDPDFRVTRPARVSWAFLSSGPPSLAHDRN